mmetsp:Transcript_12326/g.29272  ORF Transcript_12326/g.29272 Transcript_12326/m.29272 type:complete len:186 (+) Transcript_12326:392-949(+)
MENYKINLSGSHGNGSTVCEATSSTSMSITFSSVNNDNLSHLKALNRAILPVNYKDKLYSDCLAFEEVTQLAFHGGLAVGGIACRLEALKPHTAGRERARLYIVTLAVLPAYRCLGIGGQLLERVLKAVQFDENIEEASLHVQTTNEEAIRFYKKYGFEVAEKLENYYRRLNPPDCYVLKKRLQK